MSISQVRTYFRTHIATVDANMKEWKNNFDEDSAPRRIHTKSYYLELGDMESDALSDHMTNDLLDANLYIFYKDQRYYMDNLDLAYDLAHSIRLELIKPQNAMTGTNIKNVILNTATPRPFEHSDNAVVLLLNFSVNLVFGAI